MPLQNQVQLYYHRVKRKNELCCMGCFTLLPGSYFESVIVPRERKCYGFIAINQGAVEVRVNGIILLPAPAVGLTGASFAYVDPFENYFNRDFQIVFSAGAGALVQLVQVVKVE